MNMMPFLSPRGERHIYSKPDMEKYIKAISQWIDGIPYEKAFEQCVSLETDFQRNDAMVKLWRNHRFGMF